MDECQGPATLENAGFCEHVGGKRRFGPAKFCEFRRLQEIAPFEDCDGARESSGSVGQAAKPDQDRPSNGSCADSLHVDGRVGAGRDSVLLQRNNELAHEERRSAGRTQACVHELGIGLNLEPFEQELDARPRVSAGQAGQPRLTSPS